MKAQREKKKSNQSKRENILLYRVCCCQKEKKNKESWPIYLVAPLCCWLFEREACIHTHRERKRYIYYINARPSLSRFFLSLSTDGKSSQVRSSGSHSRWLWDGERHETLSYALMFQCLLNDAPPQYPYIDSLISVPRCIAAPGCSSLLWLLVSQIS